MSGRTPPYTYSYTYTVGPAPQRRGQLSTSRTELMHLGIAFVVITVDLTLVLSLDWPTLIPSVGLGAVVGLAAVGGVTGFLAHEIAHKISAQRNGYWAEFRLSVVGLVFSLIFAYVVGALFAAPGATMIGGMVDREHWGRTSLAGPLTNLGEGAVLSGVAAGLWYLPVSSLIPTLVLFLAYINGVFAAFNLIPLGPLDGAKVFRWRRPVWAVGMAVSLAFAGGMIWVLYVRGVLAF